MPIQIEIIGRTSTLNDWLGGIHWRKKADEKKVWTNLIYTELLKQKFPKKLPTPFELWTYQYTKRIRDVDNTIVATKFFLDTLVQARYIEDDTPRYVSCVHLFSRKCKKGEEERIRFVLTSDNMIQ